MASLSVGTILSTSKRRGARSSSMPPPSERFCIGYAVDQKKQESFFTQSLIEIVKKGEINLVKIDADIPLTEQGPFYCVLQKLSGEDWKEKLADYRIKNPQTLIIDLPATTARFHNRISMLHEASQLQVGKRGEETLGIGPQTVIFDQQTLVNPLSWESMSFPVVARPLMADRTSRSHKMFIAYSGADLSTLNAPVVLQPIFCGSVVYKVYVAAGEIAVVQGKWRSSSASGASPLVEKLEFSKLGKTSPAPFTLILEIVDALIQRFKMQLFSFYLTKDKDEKDRYLLLDISWFPGFSRMDHEAKSELILMFLSGMMVALTDFKIGMGGLNATQVADAKKKVKSMQDAITKVLEIDD